MFHISIEHPGRKKNGEWKTRYRLLLISIPKDERPKRKYTNEKDIDLGYISKENGEKLIESGISYSE